MAKGWIPECVDFLDTCHIELMDKEFKLSKVICKCSLHKEVPDDDLMQKIVDEICVPRSRQMMIEQAVKGE